MSIGRRFINVARAELNSLLDYASKHVDDSDDNDSSTVDDASGLSGVSAREMEEELERRRRAHEEVEEAIHGRRSPAREEAGSGKTSSSARGGGGKASDALAGDALKMQKAYATLEVPAGSNFDTVRKSYRNLMRKYHPDHHTETPAKQRAANEVAQKLTDAYKFLQKKLER